ncbi:MAG: MATE family efflux transporter [Lachnospiraceae bacterium]|nr:MATE family efflux transporter [Lachnospiraceae bacterium]
MERTKDFTKGKVNRVLLSFFFPMLLTNFLQQLYTFVDSAIVGKGLGDNALASVGNMSALVLLIIGFAQGITNGFAVVIAQYFGGKDVHTLRKAIAISIKLSFTLALVLTTSSMLFLRRILLIMQTDAVILEESLQYGYIIFAGLTVTMAYNLCAGILRALGDSKTPFLAIMISSAINILLDCLFVFILGTGVGGVAVATVSAQLVSVVICTMGLRRVTIIQLTRVDLGRDTVLASELLKNGVPMACMNSVTAVGCMLVQAYVNDLGVIYTSAYSACNRYVNLFMLPAVTAGFAVSAFTSQNLGAKEYGRIKSGVRVGLIIGLVSYLLLGFTMMVFPRPLAQLLLNSQQSINLAADFLRLCGSMFFLLNFLFVYRSAVQGMGKPFVPMCSGLLEMVVRILVITCFLPQIGFKATAYAEVLAWIGAVLVNCGAYLMDIHKKY